MSDQDIMDKIRELEPTIDAIKKLQESGVMAALESLGEQADLIINYASTMEVLGTLSLLFRIMGIADISMGKVNQEELIKNAKEIDWGSLFKMLFEILKFIANDAKNIPKPTGKQKLKDTLGELRSPETEYLIKLMSGISSKLMNRED
ncbi:hypothetical protein ACNF42_08350 [Cuniculiplasma sp. SKW3]|uniref:hypothetical protein n=1 Tax=Cuniculiplasma sp. SKW3 TaxID=3400170 RepID=UPI003FD23E81